MNQETSTDPDKKRILNLYAAFGVGLIISLVPSGAVGLIALLFLIGVLVAAYVIRKNSTAESLAENHCTFIIRTLWITAFFSLITLTAGSFYMLSGIDYAAFEPCRQTILDRGPEFARTATYDQLYALAQPCMENFLRTNAKLLINTALITALPILVYLAYRYVKGLTRALKGYRLADPKAWF